MLSHIKVHAQEYDNIEVVIQTYRPSNFLLETFLTNNYKEYIKKEIADRKTLKNTPFYEINRIFIKGKYEEIFKET